MFAKRKSKLKRLMAVVLAIMLVGYNIPVGVITKAFAQTGTNQKVFTMEILENGAPVPNQEITGHNANNEVSVTGTTDKDGLVEFPELTNALFDKNNQFEFLVASNTFSIVLTEGTTDHYIYDVAIEKLTLVEEPPAPPVKEKYIVTINQIGSGQIKLNDIDYTTPAQFEEGTKVDVAITPDPNYEIKNVKVDGEEKKVTNNEGYIETIDALSADTTIDVQFVLKTYTISFSSYKNGTVKDEHNQTINTDGGTVKVQHGSDSSFSVTPTTGYHLGSITIDGAPINLADELSPIKNGYEYTFSKVTENHQVEVTFAINTYQVTATVQGDHGTIELAQSVVDYGSDAKAVITPEDNSYKVAALKVNGAAVDLTNNDNFVDNNDGTSYTYTVKNVTKDTTIEVSFERIAMLEGDWETYVSIKPASGSLLKSYKEGNNEIHVYSKNAIVVVSAIDPYYRVDISDSIKHWKGNYILRDSTTIKRLLVAKGPFGGEEIKLPGHLILLFDTEGPTVEVPTVKGDNEATVEDATWFSGGVTVSGKIDNTEQTFDGVTFSTPIEKVFYQKGPYTPYEPGKEATFNAEKNSYSFKPDDEKYSGVYSIWAEDQAGNASTVKTVQVNIDKKEPMLADGEAVTFEQKNDDYFSKVLNFLSFGTFFNKEVEVTVRVKDDASGVEAISLKTSDEKVVPKQAEFENDGLFAQAKFTVDAESFKGTFQVTVTDHVKNKNAEPYLVTKDNSNIAADNSGVVMIEKKAPTARVDVTPKENVSSDGDAYNGDVTYDVTVQDAESGINTVSIDVNGKKLEYDYSDLTEKHTYTFASDDPGIQIKEDGTYVVSIYVVDNAGNTNTVIKTIYVDKTAPAITDFSFLTKNDQGSYEKVEQTVTLKDSVELTGYGYFFKKPTRVSVKAEDPEVAYEYTSNVKSMIVYLKDYESGKFYAVLADGSFKEIAESGVDKIAPVPTTGEFTFAVPEAFKGQIFSKATDRVNNTGTFETPDGTVIENEKQHAKESHITLEKAKTSYKDANNLELYAKNVDVNVKIADSYSGIQKVEWSVVAPYDTANNQSGSLTINNDKTYAAGSSVDGWKQTKTDLNLVTELTKTLTVKNNSNSIVVKVKVTDRAGNVSEDEMTFSIDKTAPTIQVTYDNNQSDPVNKDFYKEDRTATIVITERNFNAKDVVHKITNTDGVIPKLVGWTTKVNAKDPDQTTHTATVKYAADGDYTFDIQYKDNAENAAPAFAQQKFTIDKTKPVIKVSYSGGAAANGNYYKAARTATISITEHNFDTSRIKVSGTATDNGKGVAFPAVSGWRTSGDVHTATIHYSSDAKYHFDIDYTDMAGNIAADYKADEFFVDQTAPKLAITGVKDQSANKGDVIPVITYSDTNFNKNAVSIKIVGSNRGGVTPSGRYADVANGQVYTFNNFAKKKEVDDIYTLTAALVDKAGNRTTQMIQFSVNRFGSVYVFDEALKNIDGKYVQHATDITVTETNVDSLKPETMMVKMTKNGTPTDLAAGKDYTVKASGGKGKWSKYTYVIKKSLFAGDGRYTVALYSEDAAGNINETIDETKKAEISFGIDKTAPVIVPIDIESGEQYPVENKSVTVSIKDNLVLKGAEIYVDDKKVAHKEEGENFVFDIGSSNSKQNVKIIAVDAAGNELTSRVNDILVSTNPIVRWYNNTPVFAGSLGGVGGIAIAIGGYFLYRKQKGKDDQEEVDDRVVG
ncbi:Ig-like domain-containing protein [Bacillus sp. 1P10SD]|uniref:Ig-like domain-containing protein n=1 Tax=Bacillus sp. 1P10SD TaxID=3132265 RepID=UPI0039A76F03